MLKRKKKLKITVGLSRQEKVHPIWSCLPPDSKSLFYSNKACPRYIYLLITVQWSGATVTCLSERVCARTCVLTIEIMST